VPVHFLRGYLMDISSLLPGVTSRFIFKDNMKKGGFKVAPFSMRVLLFSFMLNAFIGVRFLGGVLPNICFYAMVAGRRSSRFHFAAYVRLKRSERVAPPHCPSKPKNKQGGAN
jgi:hypothetical protein